MIDQLTLFNEEPIKRECQHENIIESPVPFSGWKAGELKRHCGECWQWLDADGNAPELGEDFG